jgi:hypothetical protein
MAAISAVIWARLRRAEARSDDKVVLEGEEEDEGIVSPGQAEVSLSAESLMGRPPAPAACLKVGSLEKMNSESEWSDRECYLTDVVFW